MTQNEESTVQSEETCSAPFAEIDDLTGCYHIVQSDDEASWNEAEATCQSLDPRAHLVSFQSKEVRYYWQPSLNLTLIQVNDGV